MTRQLSNLLYALFKGERSTPAELAGSDLPPIAEAAGRALGAHEDLSEALDKLARALIEHDMADAADVVCGSLDWNVERCELQGRIGELWCRAGDGARASLCFDAAEESARSEAGIDMRAGALADLAVRLVKVGDAARANRVRNQAIEDAVAGQSSASSQEAVDSAKVLGQVARNLAEEGAFEEAERVAVMIQFPAARERYLSTCKRIRADRPR